MIQPTLLDLEQYFPESAILEICSYRAVCCWRRRATRLQETGWQEIEGQDPIVVFRLTSQLGLALALTMRSAGKKKGGISISGKIN